jgi:phosphate transport system ATP-binding protein
VPGSRRRLALKAEVRDLDFHYGAFHALKKVTMPIYDRR